jgi:hypothetical protein
MSSDRDIRDRLAEALWRKTNRYDQPEASEHWRRLRHAYREMYAVEADALRSVLPAVELTLTAIQSPTDKLKIEGAE